MNVFERCLNVLLLFTRLKMTRLFYALRPTTDTRGHRYHNLSFWRIGCVSIIFLFCSGHVLYSFCISGIWCISYHKIIMTSISRRFDGLIKNQTEWSSCDSNIIIIYSTLFQLPWTLQDLRYCSLKVCVGYLWSRIYQQCQYLNYGRELKGTSAVLRWKDMNLHVYLLWNPIFSFQWNVKGRAKWWRKRLWMPWVSGQARILRWYKSESTIGDMCKQVHDKWCYRLTGVYTFWISVASNVEITLYIWCRLVAIESSLNHKNCNSPIINPRNRSMCKRGHHIG